MKKINSFLKKYQPIIQTIGILLILITVIISIIQNYNTNNQFEFEKKPNLKFKVNYSNISNLTDYIGVENQNSYHTINKSKIEYLEGINLNQAEFLTNKIKTNNFKKHIIEYYSDYFDSDKTYNINTLHLTKDSISHTLPVILSVEYIENEEKKTLKKLYEYNFQVYFFGKNPKIKTLGINYIKDISDTEKNSKTILLKYVKSNSDVINNKIIKKYKIDLLDVKFMINVLKYLEYNLHESIVELDSDINDSTTVKIYLSYPKIFVDKEYKSKRDSIYNNHIINSKSSKKLFILEKINRVNDSINIFEKEITIPNFCGCKEDKEYYLNEDTFDRWRKLNLDIRNYLSK